MAGRVSNTEYIAPSKYVKGLLSKKIIKYNKKM